MATTQNRKPANNRRRKKKASNNYGYFAVGLILVAIILIAVIISLSGGDDNDTSTDLDIESSDTNTSSTPSNDASDESDASVEPVKNGWETVGDKKYYYDNGVMCIGFCKVDGVEYCFDESGALMQNAWHTVDDKTYYFGADGAKAVGKVEIDGKNHYFDTTGAEFALANPWNAVCTETRECDVDLVALPKGYGDPNKGKVDKSIYNDLMQMMDDCYNATGRDVYVISGHRTYKYQENNYNRQVNLFLSEGHSQHDAEILAAEWVAVPGTSEHHLGLAIDIIDTQIWDLVEEQEDLEGQQWLMENSWKYGFILRYPKNTKEETGINYEPWHYRYLGKELAKAVQESGLTLEKYIESISK